MISLSVSSLRLQTNLHLQELNLSHNSFEIKGGKELGPAIGEVNTIMSKSPPPQKKKEDDTCFKQSASGKDGTE